jgi:hypothetical protein
VCWWGMDECERLICAVEGEWYGWRWTYWRKEVVRGVEREEWVDGEGGGPNVG